MRRGSNGSFRFGFSSHRDRGGLDGLPEAYLQAVVDAGGRAPTGEEATARRSRGGGAVPGAPRADVRFSSGSRPDPLLSWAG